jgi:hypothetical protein
MARSSVIMMTHPPLLSGKSVNQESRINSTHDTGGRHDASDQPAGHDGEILPRLTSLHRCRFIMNL